MRMNDWYTGQARVWARGLYVGVAALGIALSAGTGAVGQSITWLGPDQLGISSVGGFISYDGRIVSGNIYTGTAELTVRWIDGVPTPLPHFGGGATALRGATRDGKILVGTSRTATGRLHAYRWEEGRGMLSLHNPAFFGSMAWGVSDDGQLVAGEAFLGGGQWRGFYWTPSSDGPQILPEPSGSEGLYLATAVSASGNVIVGCSGRNIQQSVRWLKNQQGTWVPEPIGSLGGTGSFPHAVSEQGNIVVGRSTLPDGRERAYKWVSGQGMQNLGTIGNLQSRAWGVSLDGSVVLGDVYVTGFSGMRAVRWTEQGGIEDLNQTYSSLLNGSLLETARHISANKRFIVGYGINSRTNRREVYVLDVKFREDVDGSGCVDMSDVWYIFIRLINGIACPECDANGDGVANFADAGHVFNYVNDPSKPKCWR